MIETEARRPNGYHRLKVLQKFDASKVRYEDVQRSAIAAPSP